MYDKLMKYAGIIGSIFFLISMIVAIFYMKNRAFLVEEDVNIQQKQLKDNELNNFRNMIVESKAYKYRVLINAAHGGLETGNASSKIYEKDITLSIAKKIRELNTNENIGIFLVRDTDEYLGIEERKYLIEEFNADLYIELHVEIELQNERTYGTSILYNERFYNPFLKNTEIADVLITEIIQKTKGKPNGIYGDSLEQYPLLNVGKKSGVSIILGYLSNKKEVTYLANDSYQENMAMGILNGISLLYDKVLE